MMRTILTGVLALAVLGCRVSSTFAVTLGQLDEFDNGMTLDWAVGGGRPVDGPVNVPNGGPQGVGDAFLRYTTDTVNTGGRFLVLNRSQWSGDYSSAGVTGISAFARNLGAVDLHMRLLLEGQGGGFFSLEAAELPVGGDWQSVFFPISPAALTGGNNFAQTLAAVSQIRIFHNPEPSFPGPITAASIGLDSIRAVPEPAGTAVFNIWLTAALVSCLRPRRGFSDRRYSKT